MITYNELTNEQKQFVQTVLSGRNAIVEACIGSGKTTAIQVLCDCLPADKRILYLTYNTLLKLDAKSKITRSNVQVANYHGFAYGQLCRYGIRSGVSDLIQTYNQAKLPTGRIDVMILDEYQDIDQEISEMLLHIRDCNPSMQIVAVGDMCQKIYDKTTLDAKSFIYELLGPNTVPMEFTRCFRLCDGLARELGEIWGKEIHGVNMDCEVLQMTEDEAFMLLAQCDPCEILCLGSNNGARSKMLNRLEVLYPDVFNKNTVWSKITENDGGASQPRPDCAIFTTYDGCKGMERDVCVLFDWTEDYWYLRLDKPNVRYEILRNIFCVAASRGKKKIVFVETDSAPLTYEVLMDDESGHASFEDMQMSSMFDFKFIEDVEAAFKALSVTEIQPEEQPILVPTTDGLIDLSPCVGIYQESAYFKGCSIDRYIEAWFAANRGSDGRRLPGWEQWTLDQKILYYVMLQTNQNRYFHQVMPPFVTDAQWQEIEARLASVLPQDAQAQVACNLTFYQGRRTVFEANGFADVVYENTVYELKFVEALSHVHFLQCAMYMMSLNLTKGRLWNVRTNQMFEIRIPDRKKFMNFVTVACTKGVLDKYKGLPDKAACGQFIRMYQQDCLEIFDDTVSGVLRPAEVRTAFEKRGLYLPVASKVFMDQMHGIKKILNL